MSVVAISRQVGSLGESIARLVASKLKMEFITRGFIHEFIHECDPEFAKACSMYEDEVPKSFWARNFFDTAKHAALYEWLTYKLASRGNVILLGRGTPVVLRKRRDVCRVRIVAPFEERVQAIKKEKKCSMAEAEHFVNSYGRHRRNLIESIFSVDLSDPELYDIQLNTAELTTETAADILVATIKAKLVANAENPMEETIEWATTIKEVALNIKKELDPGFWQQVEAQSGGPGHVILTGFVYDVELRELAEKLALQVEGVKTVENHLVLVNQM